jgi:hypothetical protein
MLVAATGQQAATSYDEVLAARDKPLFETLQDSPSAALRAPDALNAKASGGKASASLNVVLTVGCNELLGVLGKRKA